MFDLTVVGSGPNGLAAALVAARAGLAVRIVEASDSLGGGLRSAETIESGYLHDVCAAVHPMAIASPFFQELRLAERVRFVTPELSYAHVVRPASVGYAWRDLDRTAAGLGTDGPHWRRLFAPLAGHARAQARATLQPPLAARPRDVVPLARIGMRALVLAVGGGGMKGASARSLLAGLAAHAMHGATSVTANVIGLALGGHAHAGGWPFPVGGSQSIAAALIHELTMFGVVFETGREVVALDEVADSRCVLLDVTPRSFARIAEKRLSIHQAARYARFRYGPGAAKVDFTLDSPVPWADPWLAQAGTVHLGGTAAEVAAAERAVLTGRDPRRPFVLVAQPSAFDPSRAPVGKHVLWAYAHVPHGSTADATELITSEIEKNAPGFRDTVRQSAHITAQGYAQYNANYIGGDIGSGAVSLRQILGRPWLSGHPWRTPLEGVYLCSASTSPGPGVHGMSGWHAARVALRDVFGLQIPEPDQPPEPD